MIVDQTDGLHERIADGRADKLKASLQQVFAQSCGQRCSREERPCAFAPHWLVVYEAPDVLIETTKLLLYFEEGLGVLNCGCDFQTVADNTGIVEELFDFALIVVGDAGRIELVESGAVVFSLAKDRFPAQSRLCAFENQELKEHSVIVLGHAPFPIVVCD